MVYLNSVENVLTMGKLIGLLLPARASEQGNVIGLVSMYIYIYMYIYVIKKNL